MSIHIVHHIGGVSAASLHTAGEPGTAGLDTQDYNQCCPWPEGIRGPRYERGSQWLDSTHRCQFVPTPTEFRRRPSEGGLRVFNSLRGCHFAVEAHRDVQRIGNAQAAGANPAIGTRPCPSSSDSGAPVS